MSYLGTSLLGLGTWLDGDYPGAGSQSVISTGLNGNWLILDRALGTQHNADGTHKANVIKGSNLVQSGADTCVDGVTLEFSSNKIQAKNNGISYAKIQQISATAKLLGRKSAGAGNTEEVQVDASLEIDSSAGLRVKALGVGSSHLASNAVTTAKITDANVTAAKLATDAVETAKIKDLNVTAAKLAADAVETAKIKDANVTTAKIANNNVTTEKLEYKEYVAKIDHDGTTSPPTSTEFKNTVGTITLGRSGTGIFTATSAALFSSGKTVVEYSLNSFYFGSEDGVQISVSSTSSIQIKIYAAGVLVDGFNLILRIRVYP